MSYTYAETADRLRGEETASRTKETSEAGPSLAALRSGAASPSDGQRGRRVDLPAAMRAKMENAFGADLSAVRLYESRTVADAGAKAVTQGTNIAFAPGMLDFSTRGGQALLGHELSHVVSQARGEARGHGFLNDSALEARADREGAMAAAGQQVAMPTASLSPVTAAPAAAPMQAALSKKDDKPAKEKSFGFHSDPKEKHELPPNGIGFMLGMSNYGTGDSPANPHESSFREMMRSANLLASVKGKRANYGRLAYDAMSGNALRGLVAGMQGYQNQLLSEEEEEKKSKGWFRRHFPPRSAESKERQRQLSILGEFLARANTDREKNEKLKSTTLAPEEDRGELGKGTINSVQLFTRGEDGREESGVFKQDSFEDDRDPRYDRAALIAQMAEESVMQRIGLRFRDENGDRIDQRLPNREVAYARLASLLGSSVGLDAKLASYTSPSAGKAPGSPPPPQGGGPGESTDAGSAASSDSFARRTGPGFGNSAIWDASTDSDSSDGGMSFQPGSSDSFGSFSPMGARNIMPDSSGSSGSVSPVGGGMSFSPGSASGTSAVPARSDDFKAQDDGENDFMENPPRTMHGVLMEKAAGGRWTNYNWKHFGPDNAVPADYYEDPVVDPHLGENYRDPNTGVDPHQGETWGQRLDQSGVGLVEKTTSYVPGGEVMDANDPDFQRQMNEMFLLDTLAQHTDRHGGNFYVGHDEEGKMSVKALDNDLTFGDMGSEYDNRRTFGKRGEAFNYGGLPAHMQIDANMAKRIRNITPEMLQATFSDLLSRKEIEALGIRFDMMKQYIKTLEDEDPSLIVKEWNDETAKRELRMAGGIGSHVHESIDKSGGYSGNSYYQRMMMTLRAGEYEPPKEDGSQESGAFFLGPETREKMRRKKKDDFVLAAQGVV